MSSPTNSPDGIVQGTENDDTIAPGFTDAQGDQVDGSDGDNDTIQGFGGNDSILGGAGTDQISGGSGDDRLDGAEGNDTIYGDLTGGGSMPLRESFEWSKAPDPNGSGAIDEGDDLSGGFTQNTGSVNVAFSILSATTNLQTEYEDEDQNVSGLDAGTNDESSLLSWHTGNGGGAAAYQLSFDQSVENVEFRINDIDHDSQIKILAYDAAGNQIPVSLTAGGNLTLTDTDSVAGNDTATSQGGGGDADSNTYSTLINIDGPVARIVIEHDQVGPTTSGIFVTDVQFDVPQIDAGAAGDDEIFGGAGDDLIYGEDGNDTIYGDSTTVPGTTTRESFEWSDAPDPNSGGSIDDNDPLTASFTQNTGSVNVTYTLLEQTSGTDSEFADNDQNVQGTDAANDSSLSSHLRSNGATARYELSFDRAVEDAEFRVNDIDFDSSIRVLAWDADGNSINVDIQGGSNLTLSDSDGQFGVDTATSQGGGGSDTSGQYSALINIPGPVARIEIQHTQNGNSNSAVNITDVHFDVVTPPPAGAGYDTIFGGNGEDEIYGEAGNDSLDGGADADTVSGGAGNDTILGQGGDDSLTGGAGSDSILGGAGNDEIDAGNGAPQLDAGFPGFGIVPPIPADSDPNNDRDYVDGGAGNDQITTGDDRDTVLGGTGNDTIDAGIDQDSVDAGTGDDLVVAGEGNDTVLGGTGDDTIYGGLDPAFPDSLNIPNGPGGDPEPENGRDLLDGGEGDDVIFGQDDDDTIFGGTGEDLIDGGIDEDSIDGGAGADLLTGGAGDDTVSGGADDDLVRGEDGDDDLSGGTGDDFVTGGEGADSVTGDSGDDVLAGGAGTDTVVGGDGADVLAGGADNDRLFGDGQSGEGNTAGGDIDILSGGDGDDTLVGGSGGDLLVGGDGADVQIGGADRDTFLSVDVGDQIDGSETGDDVDTIIITRPAEVSYDPLNSENGTITFLDPVTGAPTGTATFQNVEQVIIDPDGSSLPPAGPNLQSAPAGGSTPDLSQAAIAVLGGSDEPPYVPGDGIVDGTAGADNIDLGTYVDPEGDQIDAGDALLPGEAPDDDIVLAGGGNDFVDGNQADDEIYGEDGNDTLLGNDGNDEILGGEGDDSLSGGDGNDVLAGGIGNDDLSGGADNDLLGGGDGDDTLSGGEGNDALFGNEGNDNLDGGTGGDLLVGGSGNDQINLGSDNNIDLALGGDDQDTFTGIGQNDRVDGGEGGNDNDTLDLTGAAEAANAGGSLQIEYLSNPENGVVTFFNADGDATGTMEFFNIENVIPCFTPGTLIATPVGERKVEDLRPGDRVITRDNGIQAIRWVGRRDLGAEDLAQARHLQPVMIRAGALGNGLPERDLIVSPNHRVLIANDRTALYFEDSEVLVAAKHLVGLDGVEQLKVEETSYIHFMFDRHEVVLSDGAWTESFQPGDYTLSGMGDAQRKEIFELFPELQTEEGLQDYHAARRSLKKHEVHALFQ